MRIPTRILYVAVTAAFALMAAKPEGVAGTFRVYTQVVAMPEAGELTNLVLQTDTGRIAFLPPPGWRMRFEPKDAQIVWTSADYTSVLSLKVVPDPDGSLRTHLASRCRSRLAQEEPELRIVDEFVCYTAGQTGQAFDVQRSVPGRELITGRVACIPISGAVADLRLFNPESQRQQRQTELVMFLNSFRVAEHATP